MKKQMPNWLFALIVASVTIGALWGLGRATPSATAPDAAEKSAQKQTPAPDFSGKTIDGKDFKLSDYKGKVVLVNFWATWCGPCRMEMPDLIRLQEKYGPKGFTVIGLSEDDSPELVKKFVPQAGLNYPVMMATSEIAQAYGVSSLPTSFLVNKEGKVVWAMAGVNPQQTPETLLSPEIEKALQ